MKRPGFKIMKDGSINGKIVALGITVIVLFIYIAGFWVPAIAKGLKDYGHQLLEFYGLSIGIYFLQKIGKPGVTAVAQAIVNKVNGRKPGEIPEKEGDA